MISAELANVPVLQTNTLLGSLIANDDKNTGPLMIEQDWGFDKVGVASSTAPLDNTGLTALSRRAACTGDGRT